MSAAPHTYDLTARYDAAYDEPILLTGVQAIARLLVEQHVRDAGSGMHTASFVSGYQGSPLGGLDFTLAGIPSLRERHDVHLVPGLNEELAATAVWGSQQELPGRTRTHDGVVGVWYAKAPGVDRAGDALRHGHVMGAHPRGGVLVLAGDDPGAKSSTLPSASEGTLAAHWMPVLFPRNSAEVVQLGLFGVAMSRASGCWIGMKITTDVADGLWSLEPDFGAIPISLPQIEWDGTPWVYVQRGGAIPPASLLAEQDLVGPRWAMVREFADANPLDEVSGSRRDAWLGIVAPGKTHDTLVQTLHDLGLDGRDWDRAGIRILRLGLVHPLAPDRVMRFVRGLERVLVVEEKQGFVETQLRDLLYGTSAAPEIVGKADEHGRPLVPADGELTAGRLVDPLRRVLTGRVPLPPEVPPRTVLPVLPVQRTPYFCSGCPHNRSTVVPEESLVGGGIGCHAMAALMPHTAPSLTGLTQMGGEGAQWIGQAPFTHTSHIFQNMGDGTYFHSGQLAVQACVAAGVDITFKILYNAAVAMTGGQDAKGSVPVPELTRKLHAEGVCRIIVCADEPEHYGRDAMWAPGVDVWHRDRLDHAQQLLRDTPGVTVLIYDDQCAADARRRRKRGQQPVRTRRVIINEEVCEGCGDCGVKSNCLSVQPVETEFGRKTRIDQASCNTDYSCLDGDCPSFVTVEVPTPTVPRTTEVELPEPPPPPAPTPAMDGRTHNVLLMGIGGTGIVTVNQVLATAALLDGLQVEGLDQTGLSQKAGPVTSHLRFARGDLEPANRIGAGQADCLLAFDLLTASDTRHLQYLEAGRTRAIVSTSRTPTGTMVHDPGVAHPDQTELLDRLEQVCREVTALDTLGAAQSLVGDTVVANLLLVGAAVQAGALPLAPENVEAAIALNGVAVLPNLAAFRWGRLAIADPAAFQVATRQRQRTRSSTAAERESRLLTDSPFAGETRRLAEVRTQGLEAYDGSRLARRYVDLLELVWSAERRLGERTELSEAVAKGLHHLMAYKDEYEVARLLTQRDFARQVREEVPGATRLRYQLHPPMLRAIGLKKKIAVGPVGHAGLRVLARLRFLRGTALDPFGHTRIRRLERRLVSDYIARVRGLVADLTTASYETAVAVASSALLVRGYEGVKLASVERYHSRLVELGALTTDGEAA